MSNNLTVIQSKIVDKQTLKSKLKSSTGKKVVFSNGCFDILHRGHIEYLAQAANFGDILVIGLNTDNSVRRLKGKTRPLQDETSRTITLAALQFVDFVVLFDEDTPYDLINFIKPDVLVKGADYKAEDIVGYDVVTGNGGCVKTIELTKGYSTTAIVEKAKK